MSTEVATDQTELTPEQQAAEDAAFEAGFNSINPTEEETTSNDDAADDESASNTGTVTEEDDGAAAAAAEAEAAKKAAEDEANAPVTITKADFNRLMAIANEVPNLREQITKTHDTFAGRFGSVQQTINALKAKAESGSKASVKQLKRLEAEFPELANLLKEDLSEAFGSNAAEEDAQSKQQEQAQADDPLKAEQQTQQQQAPAEDEESARLKELARTELAHPGFRQMAQTDEFKEWTATLPPAAVNLLNSSWDSSVMIPAFKDFKTWKEQRQVAKSTKTQSDKRLERAMTATDGKAVTGQHVVDEDAIFEESFNKVRKGGR